MKKVSIKNSSEFSKSFFRLAIFALIIAISSYCEFTLGQRSAFAQAADVSDQVESLMESDLSNEESDLSENPELNDAALRESEGHAGTSLLERKFTLTHVVQIAVISVIIIWGYSLVMSGKLGGGWMVLSAIFSVLSYIGRKLKSLFLEVTSSNEVSDWDDD